MFAQGKQNNFYGTLPKKKKKEKRKVNLLSIKYLFQNIIAVILYVLCYLDSYSLPKFQWKLLIAIFNLIETEFTVSWVLL